jgi:hypothetical protein
LNTKQDTIVFDVKKFGALGDGASDDTAAIQAAVDACHIAGGGTVWFPKGLYKLSNNPIKLYSGVTPSIVPYSNVTLAGAGSDGNSGSILAQSTPSVDVIKGLNDAANGAQAVGNTIKNLTVRNDAGGTNSGNGLYLAQQSPWGPSFQQWHIQDVRAVGFQGVGKYGFNFESIIVSTVERCITVGCANGFFLNGALTSQFSSVSTSVTFLNCYANMALNGAIGYRCTDNTYVSFIGCAADYSVSSAGSAYLVEGSNAVTFQGCGFEVAGGVTLSNGFKIIFDANANPSSQIVLTGCYGYLSNGTREVWVASTCKAVVTGFQSNSSVAGSTGLWIDSAATVVETLCTWSAATPRVLNNAATWRTPGVPRVVSVASSAAPNPAAGLTDVYYVTAASVAMTVAVPPGTPVDGQLLDIQYKDNGTARTIAHNAIFISGPGTMLTTTVVAKTVREVFQYNATTLKWVCMASYPTGW